MSYDAWKCREPDWDDGRDFCRKPAHCECQECEAELIWWDEAEQAWIAAGNTREAP